MNPGIHATSYSLQTSFRLGKRMKLLEKSQSASVCWALLAPMVAVTITGESGDERGTRHTRARLCGLLVQIDFGRIHRTFQGEEPADAHGVAVRQLRAVAAFEDAGRV